MAIENPFEALNKIAAEQGIKKSPIEKPASASIETPAELPVSQKPEMPIVEKPDIKESLEDVAIKVYSLDFYDQVQEIKDRCAEVILLKMPKYGVQGDNYEYRVKRLDKESPGWRENVTSEQQKMIKKALADDYLYEAYRYSNKFSLKMENAGKKDVGDKLEQNIEDAKWLVVSEGSSEMQDVVGNIITNETNWTESNIKIVEKAIETIKNDPELLNAGHNLKFKPQYGGPEGLKGLEQRLADIKMRMEARAKKV